MLSAAALLHYGDLLPLFSEAADNSPVSITTRQSAERIMILVPVTYAALTCGARGGAMTLALGFAILLPRAIMPSSHTDHAVPELAGVLVVAGLLVVAITQQKRDVQHQRTMGENMRYFVHQVITSQEDERKRIAMELHDETAQALLVSCQRLDRLIANKADQLPADVSSQLQDLRTSTVDTLTGLRRLTQHLRPRIFDDHGLVPALEWLADTLKADYGIAARVEVTGSPVGRDVEMQLLLFRIAQEALNNAGRHSGGTEVVLALDCGRQWTTLTVSDNGNGFDLSPRSDLAKRGKLGLLGMEERARLLGGTLEINTSPGRGTSVAVKMPTR
jgi:signal transduction histidine kinase